MFHWCKRATARSRPSLILRVKKNKRLVSWDRRFPDFVSSEQSEFSVSMSILFFAHLSYLFSPCYCDALVEIHSPRYLKHCPRWPVSMSCWYSNPSRYESRVLQALMYEKRRPVGRLRSVRVRWLPDAVRCVYEQFTEEIFGRYIQSGSRRLWVSWQLKIASCSLSWVKIGSNSSWWVSRRCLWPVYSADPDKGSPRPVDLCIFLYITLYILAKLNETSLHQTQKTGSGCLSNWGDQDEAMDPPWKSDPYQHKWWAWKILV